MAQTLAMPVAPSLALISNPRPLSRAVYFPVLNPPKVRGLSIECARVGGVEIPNNKRIEFSLQYIHGIGRSRARKILCDISVDNKVTKDLSEEELITLRDKVSKYVIEGDLIGTFAEEGKRNLSAMRCRGRTHHLLYQRQALRIFQRSLGWIISLSLQAGNLLIADSDPLRTQSPHTKTLISLRATSHSTFSSLYSACCVENWIIIVKKHGKFSVLKMGEEVKAIVPESVLKKQKREEEWALKKKEELDAAKKKRAESRKLIYSRAKQYAKEYQEQWEDRMPRRLFRYDVTACETKV
ncbi:30S ribosomal protein [Arachis hypogaea]|nr:30S ribosomal protein [Arachis hypogaea]